MTITTAEVAEMLGVTEGRVRQLVIAGDLTPAVRGARPMLFRESEVIEYELDHRREKVRISRLAQAWRAEVASVC